MYAIETLIIQFLLNFVGREELNVFLRDPRAVATLLGALIAISGALLGTFLLLRGMSLTSDAISHTVLLGIVVAFLIMTRVFNQPPDLASPWLIIGAGAAGVATVVLTELIQRSGLVKQDAALGLAFPLLFAVAVILVARFIDDVHLDADSVMVGEIGVAWANTNSHCLENCETVIITPDDPRAEVSRQCSNCRDLGISPRDANAEFIEACTNCGEYSPAQAWQAGLVTVEPSTVFFPRALSVMAFLTLLTIGFVTVFYKELKLASFDSALAQALGFRPGALTYALMVMVSLVAVGAFDAVGSILVIAFFIIPAAAAYLLTDRLSVMLLIAPLIGTAGAYFGYDLARGSLFGVVQLDDILAWINRTFDAALPAKWDSSISASMVLVMALLFVAAWIFSPRYGLVATLIRRARQRRVFADQVVMGHIYNHQQIGETDELAADSLHNHFDWTPARMQFALARLRASNFVRVQDNLVQLTDHGLQAVETFRHDSLGVRA
ncbi:MAG: metal ABC transporter permease [Anaerolineae bacterium]|nr:metal ABC transporter permease [Anaerolineae bacterium]